MGIVERSLFEVVEEGVEGEKGRHKAGGLSPKAGTRPAALRRPLAGLGLGKMKAGPRPAAMISYLKKKK